MQEKGGGLVRLDLRNQEGVGGSHGEKQEEKKKG